MNTTRLISYRRRIAALVLALFGWGLSTSPAAAQPGRQVQIEFQGLTLNGWLTEAESPVSTVLMLHGSLAHGNMEIMATLAEAMAENGIDSLRISLSLGQDDRQGMFDCSSPHGHRHGDAIPELAAWTQWLVASGREKFVLLGHSRGTNQVARYAAESPDEVSAMVLVAPSVYRPGEASLSQEQIEALERARTLVAAGQGGTLMSDVGVLHCAGAEVTAESFLSYYDPDPGFDTLALAAGSALPVLVVVGSEDPLSEGVADEVAAIESSGSMTLLDIDGADHFFRDLYAYDLVEGMQAWLDATGQIRP